MKQDITEVLDLLTRNIESQKQSADLNDNKDQHISFSLDQCIKIKEVIIMLCEKSILEEMCKNWIKK